LAAIFTPLVASVVAGMGQATRELVERALEGLSSPPYRRHGTPVSAIVPTHNEENYLPACLECLSNQTHAPIEEIVVDYGSEDATREVAYSYGARVIEAPEPGVGNARDLGAEAASYDVLFFTDADTIFENRLVEEMLESLETHDVVTVSHVYYDTRNPILVAGAALHRLRGPWLVSARGTLIDRDLLFGVGGWEVPIWEERHLSKKLLKAGATVKKRNDLAVATSARAWYGRSRALRLLKEL